MGSNASVRRTAAIAQMRDSLAMFYPERSGDFLCPGCLLYVDQGSLTDAHVIPEAAGGRLTTVLCPACNGPFGTRRDKWLGEYLRLFRLDQPTVLHEREQRGYFYLNDVRVSGRYGVSEDGTLQFTMWPDRTSPQSLAALPQQFRETGPGAPDPSGPVYERARQVKIGIPGSRVYENRDLITLGFLTAAYLTLFRAFGYTWALQHHLNPVRQQLHSDTLTILPRCFSAAMPEHRFLEPWVGFGDVEGELAVLAGMAERVMIFPPADAPNLYERLPQDTLEGCSLRIRRRIPIRPRHPQVQGPAAVLFGNRMVICPDVFLKGKYPLIYVPEQGDVVVLHPTPPQEFEKIKRDNPAGGLSIKSNIAVPDDDTAR